MSWIPIPEIPVMKLPGNGWPKIPTRATEGSAAFDLYAMFNETVYVGGTSKIHTGIAMAIPEGYCGLVLPRSGLATKFGITVANSPGLIDSDYRGEIMVALHNEGTSPYAVEAGTRVAQLLIVGAPRFDLVDAEELTTTERGAAGFGSTGT